ncbi:hypothetical protein BFJ69_g16180 [Fusarium oxysporum]|uniref:DDE-1 domain-containing protein n=1 Tax=Fusarium oxysporum TaxID=5507 RepID=A0A420MC15_FUSOX|nr:hypothetical protein BFJ69_g16180 [Fusarium oxysporum]
MWYRRFCDDHPELRRAFLKAAEKSRKSWEAGGISDTKEWFERLTEAIVNHRINASECWNTDQAGVRVGILRERVQCLIMRTKREARAQVLSPEDRETCTVIGTGNASGATTPPWLIFKSFPTLGWAYIDGDPNMRFAQSESAFSNGDITEEWARHFNRHSWEKSSTAKSRGQGFEKWFGCDEHLRDPLQRHISYDVPPTPRKEEEIIWRLLVVDGFSGHGAFDFREYCIKFNILVDFLPPHSTHFLQPMDDIFYEGFTAANIVSGFTKSGISPPTDRPVVTYLLQKQLKAKKAVDPAFSFLLPKETRFQVASDTTKCIRERYHDTLSSPTMAGLQQVSLVLSEAVLLETTVKLYSDDRRPGIEKQYNKRKRGKAAKPVGEYIHNMSLQEVPNQQEAFIAEIHAK